MWAVTAPDGQNRHSPSLCAPPCFSLTGPRPGAKKLENA